MTLQPGEDTDRVWGTSVEKKMWKVGLLRVENEVVHGSGKVVDRNGNR